MVGIGFGFFLATVMIIGGVVGFGWGLTHVDPHPAFLITCLVVAALGAGVGALAGDAKGKLKREQERLARAQARERKQASGRSDDLIQERSNKPLQERSDKPLPSGVVKCYRCSNTVKPQKYIGPVIIVLFLAGILPALFYAAFAPKRCPICKAKL